MAHQHCPACNATITLKAKNTHAVGTDGRKVIGIYNCPGCGAYLGECYKGELYTIVKPTWHDGPDEPEFWVYYDINTLGTDGIKRHHGWIDSRTHKITQTG